MTVQSLVSTVRAELHALARPSEEAAFLQHYAGTSRPVLCVPVGELRALAKSFARTLPPELAHDERTHILDALYAGDSFEERLLAGMVLHEQSAYRRQLHLDDLERWLRGLSGWAEIDSTCQSGWSNQEVLRRWQLWDAYLERFAEDAAPSLRRAGLVLLVFPLRGTDDPRLRERAFANIERLKGEKDVLITKAISWLLRTLLRHHAAEVRAYLDSQEATLPRIAVRETRKKMETGKK